LTDRAAAPLIVAIGGTTQPNSSTERALAIALAAAADAGMRVRMFGGDHLSRLPLYVPGQSERTAEEHDFIAAVREASGVIIASPGYHGCVSGVVKNALDLIEETAGDARPYLSDLPIGLIVTAYGWQATGTTIAALRAIGHALRGWPTPFAAAINSSQSKFDGEGGCSDPAVLDQLRLVGQQVAKAAA
jgi:FMN reductase